MFPARPAYRQWHPRHRARLEIGRHGRVIERMADRLFGDALRVCALAVDLGANAGYELIQARGGLVVADVEIQAAMRRHERELAGEPTSQVPRKRLIREIEHGDCGR